MATAYQNPTEAGAGLASAFNTTGNMTPAQISAINTAASLVPNTKPISTNAIGATAAPMPPVPSPADYSGVTTAATGLLAANGTSLVSPTTDTSQSGGVWDLVKQYAGIKPASATDQYNQDYAAGGVDQKQATANTDMVAYQAATDKYNALNAQIKSLDYQKTVAAVQSQQDAQGRGITAGGLAPIDAAKQREILLQQAPIQFQALIAQSEQATALGKAQLSASLVQQAQDHVDKLFQLHTQDAQNQYNYQRDVISKLMDYASKKEENQLKALEQQKQNDFTTQQNQLNNAQSLATEAIKNGQSALAGKLLGLDPTSKTYSADVAKLAGQIAPRVAAGSNIPTIKSINGQDMQWNPSTQKWENPSGTTTTGSNQANLADAQSNVNLITGLTTNNYMKGAVGPSWLGRLSPYNTLSNFTGGKQNFIAGVEQLRSQLNLDKLIQAKSKGATFGALSDNEGRMLANAATKIGTWAIKDASGQVTGYNASEADFKAELDKINNFAKLDYVLKGGNPTDVGSQMMPDGSLWTTNSDGTYTKIK